MYQNPTQQSDTTSPFNKSLDNSLDQDSSVRVETLNSDAPHNAVKAEDLSVFVGGRCLLSHTELKLAENMRSIEVETPRGGSHIVRGGTCYGLVGPNGCGKSTLLRLMASRSVPVPCTWDVFLVGQHLPLASERDAIEEVLSANEKRSDLLRQQVALEAEIQALDSGDGEKLAEVNKQLSQLLDEVSVWDNAPALVADLLFALGFQRCENAYAGQHQPAVSTPMNQLSGGWRMKVELAKALWLQPKLLLLDEPTNHLDYQALKWLEEKLEEYPHTSVVVSHDVNFLHGACHEILWMKDQKLEALPQDMVSQEDLLRMQRRKALNFRFIVPADDAADHGLSFHGVQFSYADSGSSASSSNAHLHVKNNVRFSGKSRCVLLGRNGSGKSTFLNLCAGKLSPTTGVVDLTQECKIGQYSQQTYELDCCPEETAASYLVRECGEALEARVGVKKQAAESRGRALSVSLQKRLVEAARGVLSNFGFEGDIAVSVPLWRLSGGQRACLKFAALSLKPAHILLLDEPTNHLDAEACEALAKGLSEFKGGIVAATHDDLLIYRLIHCNWAESELLICKSGTVAHLKDFSAHCLNTLKASLRTAEVQDLASKDSLSKKSRGQKLSETASPSLTGSAPVVRTVVVKGQVPPWLQSHRRVQRHSMKSSSENTHKENLPSESTASVQTTALDAKIAVQPSEPCSKVLLSEGSRSVVVVPLHESNHHAQSTASCMTHHNHSHKGLNVCDAEVLKSDLLDSWETLLEDEGTSEEKPFQMLPCADTMPSQTASQLDSATIHSEQAKISGSHSRFRKDLVNLNKAVSKWMKQVAKNELELSKVHQRILDSKAALHLKAVHNEAFDAEAFVHEVLQHSGSRNALVT